jgi:hypothetical protein
MTEHDPADPEEPERDPVDSGMQAASVHDGVQHLQRAAQESIAAVRALLDVVEELVADPRTVNTLLSGLSSLTDLTKSGIVDKHRSPPREPAGGDDDGGVQRIPGS